MNPVLQIRRLRLDQGRGFEPGILAPDPKPAPTVGKLSHPAKVMLSRDKASCSPDRAGWISAGERQPAHLDTAGVGGPVVCEYP